MTETERDRNDDVGNVGGICVVTVRASDADQDASKELLDILATFTSVCLLTVGLKDDATARDHHEVVEFATGGTGRTPLSMAIRFLANQLRLCRAIRSRDERVVLFFGPAAYVVPIAFARLVGKTVVVEPRGNVPLTLKLRWAERLPGPIATGLARAVWLLERVSYWIADAIITYTPAMAHSLQLDRYDAKLYTNGARHVPTEDFGIDRPYEGRPRRVGFVGRLDVEKGIPTLATVAKRLAPDIEFVFVGDGDYRTELERELATEIEAGHVTLTGWIDQSDVPEYLNGMQLLVMPSAETEGLPSTVLESFACGTPVYATPVAGIPDAVVEGETGFHMRSTDPEHVAGRIRTILDRDDLSEMSASARRLVEREYSFDATVNRYEAMFAEIA